MNQGSERKQGSIDVLNPVEVERRILEISNRIAKSAAICDERYRKWQYAEHVYELAYAKAFVSADCAQTEKKHRAILATEKEHEDMIIAEASYRYSDRLAKALQAELMAYQSVNRSVLATYGAAGVGER